MKLTSLRKMIFFCSEKKFKGFSENLGILVDYQGGGGFIVQETKNLKKCDLDLIKGGGVIREGIYDEYNGIPRYSTIFLRGQLFIARLVLFMVFNYIPAVS